MEWSTLVTQLVTLVLTVVSVDAIRRLIRNRIERKGYPLPPGPTPLPFLGNVLSVDTKEPFRTYTEWQAKYGDIMYIRLVDMDVVVLNSPSVAMELFGKRSQTYSDRPYVPTTIPYGHETNLSLVRYGEHWKLCRRIFHQTFRAEAAVGFHPMQLRVARQMVLNVLDDPSNYASHYSTFGAAISMRSVYDYDPSPQNDRMVSIVKDFIEASASAFSVEKVVLIKAFPFVLHIPDWLPGSWIKRDARVSREASVKMVETPYQYVRKRMESKEGVNPSMVSDHITRMKEFDDSYRTAYENALKVASSTAFLGSVETTSSTLMSFTLAMVKNPRIRERAQAEIDAVVGTERLPDFDDRLSLPYVDAIMRETLRWQPAVPLGTPHSNTSSDIYNGFYIPKGAIIFGNIWAMSRDETRYPNAEKFIPERFLDGKGMLTDEIPDFVFGFGRRVCPGRYAADASLWSAMVTMLATLDFNPVKRADGKDIPFEVEYVNGLARRLSTFPCHLVPRAHVSKAFLERAFAT